MKALAAERVAATVSMLNFILVAAIVVVVVVVVLFCCLLVDYQYQ